MRAGQDDADEGDDGCSFAAVKWCRCTSRDGHTNHVFYASSKAGGGRDLYCIFCAEGGGGGPTQAERRQQALAYRRANEAITAASKAINMSTSAAAARNK